MIHDYAPPDEIEIGRYFVKDLLRGFIWAGYENDWPERQWLVWTGENWIRLFSSEGDEIRRWIGIRDDYADSIKAPSA